MHWLASETGQVNEWAKAHDALILNLDSPLAGKVATLLMEDDPLYGAEVVALLQVDHLLYKRFDECSSGERQLVRIAYALLKRPEAIVLHEPFRYLDRYRREHLTMLLERLGRLGVTIGYTERANERGVHPTFTVTPSEGKLSLDVRNVSYRHPLQPVYAVEDVTFVADMPGLTVFIGTNGSGKSTLIELMAKSMRPLQGKIRRSVRPLYLPPEEEYGPFPHARNRRVEQLRAVLASSVPIVLLDEPTVGLTREEREAFYEALLEKRRTAQVVCATHDTTLLNIADRIVSLSNGRIVFDGTRNQFMERSLVWSHSSSAQ
ncbi:MULTISPECIES: ATP-binding cassette domain-containing protein [Exiguobacterium]|uniref:ATP-binding cassette domain-containing protein n=1 Tax=Exiguobacterium TaxID=33986 RepID=UPI001BE5729D|nr:MULTISPECIES: ATP-binding cassette domain-containing protein [Exiguobacterium]MCT4782212.1 ATP-binding cassette domain-containing protein [Exiguobacterium himgiriensis]